MTTALASNVAPQDEVSFTFDITPTRIGQLTVQVRLVLQGVWRFGEASSPVKVAVIPPATEPAQCNDLRTRIAALDAQILQLSDSLTGNPRQVKLLPPLALSTSRRMVQRLLVGTARVGAYRRVNGRTPPTKLDFLPAPLRALMATTFRTQPASAFWWPVMDCAGDGLSTVPSRSHLGVVRDNPQ